MNVKDAISRLIPSSPPHTNLSNISVTKFTNQCILAVWTFEDIKQSHVSSKTAFTVNVSTW